MQFKEVNNLYSTTKVRWGIIRTKNKSDELDSATVVLTHINAIDIEPYDLIELTNEDNQTEYWLVANYNKTYVTYESPYLYDYTVDLMSFTKWLETINLPSMTITNIGQNRTIRSYIEFIVNHYIVPEIDKGYVQGASFDLDSRFDNVCPEMTFQQPTAREYLDWMVANYGCIIKADYDPVNHKIIISTLDLNTIEAAMPTTYIKNIVETQSAEDYVTELDHTIEDVIGQKPITEYVKLKGDGYVFNSDNAVGILSYKPYDIVKVVLKTPLTMHRSVKILNPVGPGNVPTEPAQTVIYNDDVTINDLDITNYFVFEKIWNSLNITTRQKQWEGSETARDAYLGVRYLAYKSASTTKSDLNIDKNVQNNSLYWTRGNTILNNFNKNERYKQFWGEIVSETVIENAIMDSWLNQNWSNSYDATKGWQVEEEYDIRNYDWSNLVFEVTYISYVSSRLKLPQKQAFRHLISMQDNSTNALTELASYIRQSLEKNSKLGNKSKIFTGRSTVGDNYTPKFSVGQYWMDENNDKYILTNLEYETKQNSILYKGTLTKNFTNRYINTIINREKRYYALADSGEAVTRNEVFKTKVKISTSTTAPGDIKKKVLRPAGYMYFNVGVGEMGLNSINCLMASTSYGDNVVIYNAAFYDNVIFSTQISDLTAAGGYKMDVNKYVDENGEFEWISFAFKILTSEYNYQPITNSEINSLATYEGNYSDPYLTVARTKTLNKDSRERISITEECFYITNDPNIELGRIAELVKYYGNRTKKIRVTFTTNRVPYSTDCTLREFVECDWVQTFMSNWPFLVGDSYTGTLVVFDIDSSEVYMTIKNHKISRYLNYTIQEA